VSIKIIREITWRIGIVTDTNIYAQGMTDGRLQTQEFFIDDFSPKDRDKIKDDATFKEVEFYEDDEDGQRNHCILIKFNR
jgi:hypothetical protein